MITTQNYPYLSWHDKFPDEHKVKFVLTGIDPEWKKIIKEGLDDDEKIKELKQKIKTTAAPVFPYPDLMFQAFRLTSWNNVRVVILGQDPYFNYHTVGGKVIPEAMGLSFSVPTGIPIPSSLRNIFNNLKKYGHIADIPKSGNLENWSEQGILLLNASLTVEHKQPNGHYSYWQKFTDGIIKYISENKDNVTFVLWGSFALKKLDLIDKKKHKVAISSHPSGLSYNKKLGNYPSFEDCDFTEISKS